jgi:hypothetical protein
VVELAALARSQQGAQLRVCEREDYGLILLRRFEPLDLVGAGPDRVWRLPLVERRASNFLLRALQR